MNATLRNSLFALTVIGTLSLAACKTGDAVDSSAPAAAPAPAPAMESAPPAADSTTPPATAPADDTQSQGNTAPTTTP